MLFSIVPKKSIFETNPELLSIPEFANLSEKQMRFLVYAYDYRSPYRQLPMDDRKKKAALTAGYKIESSKNFAREGVLPESMEKGASKYLELQYDEDWENLKAFDEQMKEIRDFLKKKDKKSAELKMATQMMKDMVSLNKAREELVKSMGLRDGEEEDSDIVIKEVSTLDLINQEDNLD